jgi:hypothetical protein
LAATIYGLCALVACACACMLLLGYRRSRYRLLLWSGYCFAGLTLNNVLLVADKILLPEIDLFILRLAVSLASFMVLIYGLIWDAN